MKKIVIILLAFLFSVMTIILGGRAEELYGKKDPGQVVTDEVAGYFLSVSLLIPVTPFAAGGCAFILFRIFDILKPPPANLLERLRGGWGLTLDDIAAGFYSCILAHLIFLFLFPGMIVR